PRRRTRRLSRRRSTWHSPFSTARLERGAHDGRQGHGGLFDGAFVVAWPLGGRSRRRARFLHAGAEPRMSGQDLSQFSMLDLFRVEAETQAQVLTAGLLALERDDAAGSQLEACMRAAHSLKGAARIVAASIAPVRPEDPANHRDRRASDRVLRVTADNLNRLLSLAGESLVESRWARPFAESLLRLKRLHHELGLTLEGLHDVASERALDDRGPGPLADARRRVEECQQVLVARLADLDMFDRRSISLAHRLYDEALACRMRPFADGVEGLPRMVRDLARSLGRQVRLDIVGGSTQVDRDILAKLDAPLGHL